MTDTAAGPGFALPRGVEPGRAVVVGAGPNGLTAAALLAREGWEVDVFERAPVPGGACASAPVLGRGPWWTSGRRAIRSASPAPCSGSWG